MTSNKDALEALEAIQKALPTGVEFWDAQLQTIRDTRRSFFFNQKPAYSIEQPRKVN